MDNKPTQLVIIPVFINTITQAEIWDRAQRSAELLRMSPLPREQPPLIKRKLR